MRVFRDVSIFGQVLFGQKSRDRAPVFRVETIDGSAVEGEDYEPLNEILTFEPNEREKEVARCSLSKFRNFLMWLH